ncbi:MAG: NAD(P)H-hydrate dehydratase [Ignavibacteria bacterium]|nr:NAD(P)H-hydrate dehydratase [Ignavibacteria bacterium]
MKPAFTFEEIREAEKTIIEKDGVPSLILMENAGRNAFDVICNIFPDIESYSVFILCGKGNNAGDGFVIARHLAISGVFSNVVCISATGELKGDAKINFNLLNKSESELILFLDFEEFRKEIRSKKSDKKKYLIIDALLGSGIKGELSGFFNEAIESINYTRTKYKYSRVVSIDVPSGLMSGKQINPVVNADYTITMGAIKTEMLYGTGKESCGEITVVPIGINSDYLKRYNIWKKYDVEFTDVTKLFPKRKKSSFKYSNGKVLIIGGSKGLSGAVLMSSLAALKTGTGAVLAAFPSSITGHFSKKLFEVIKTELDETSEGTIAGDSFERITKQIDKADAILIGPGLSLNAQTKDFLFDLIKNCDKNLVIDADALTLIAGEPSVLLNRKHKNQIILTPHIGEFSRLSGYDAETIIVNRFEVVIEFAAKFNVNVILKSETSLSCTAEGLIYLNSSGNESLASAGSGDVLSGILVTLLALTCKADEAMICGNYLHGMIADMYYKKHGNKQTASQQDLIKFIPGAVTRILS